MVFFERKIWWKDIYWLLKSSWFELFNDGKYGFFWVKKLMEKMIFTDYGKVIVLKFLVVGNTVFFWVKKLMERWYLLVTQKSLFWTFWWWEIGLSLSQEVDGKMVFTGYREGLVLNVSVMGNTIFYSVKKLMERWYLLGLFELSMIFKDLRNTVFRATVLKVRFTFCWFT